MAIPDDRLSTTPIPADYIDPDGRDRSFREDYEDGPIALQDTSEGLKYQPWKLTSSGGNFTLTPELVGSPTVILTGQDVVQCSFSFDQNARPAIVWIDSSSMAKLYWYDSVLGDFTITDFGIMRSAMLSLDDKRYRQSGASDILFWYTLLQGDGTYNLYHRKQRNRYDTEILMAEGTLPLVYKTGMHEGLRGQITLAGGFTVPVPPTVPPARVI